MILLSHDANNNSKGNKEMLLDEGSKLLESKRKCYSKVQKKDQSATLGVTDRLSS